MNLVREIVESKALVMLEEVKNDLPQLLEKALAVKIETLRFLESVYVKFTCRPRPVSYMADTQALIDQVSRMQESIDEVIKLNVIDAMDEIAQYRKQLLHATHNLNVSYEFNHYHKQLQLVKMHVANKKYLDAAKILKMFSSLEDKKENEFLRRKIQSAAVLEMWHFIKILEGMLKDHFEYSTTIHSNLVTYSLTIKPKTTEIEEAIRAFSYFDELNYIFWSKLKEIVWNVITSIVRQGAEVNINGNKCIINAKPKQKCCQVVFENLSKFLTYFSQSLQFSFKDEQTILTFFISNKEEYLQTLLINDCLDAAMPVPSAELNSLTEQAVTLEKKLKEAQLLNPLSGLLTDYISNAKIHMGKKLCKQYKRSALTLVKEDVAAVNIIGEPFNPSESSTCGFPQCAVSKSTVELLNLVSTLLQEETLNTDSYSGCFVHTAISILNLYEKVVREYHEGVCQCAPKQLAIMHNNCKYIVHELNTMAWKNRMQKLPAAFQQYQGMLMNSLQLHAFGVELLAKATNTQRRPIVQRVEAAGENLTDGRLDAAVVEKAVRQCLRQLELLQAIWVPVLAHDDYNRTMGTLLDALCTSIVSVVLRVPPMDREHLLCVLRLIVASGPKLLPHVKCLDALVPHWGKLTGIICVLDASLVVIQEQWAEGKGPLAAHCTHNELRTLILVLFPSSDRRAAVLAQI